MTAVPPQVSVIVPIRDGGDRLTALLRALEAQTDVDLRQVELILVDHRSLDGAVERARPTLPTVRKILCSAPTVYAARNAGLSVAGAARLAFTDVDCVPARDWVRAGLDAVEQSPRVAGAIRPTQGPAGPLVAAIDQARWLPQDRYVDEGWACTANLWVRREVFDDVGGFDARLRSGGDMEWGRRATRRGVDLRYAPEVVVDHPVRPTLRALVRRARRVGIGVGQAARLGAVPGTELLAHARSRARHTVGEEGPHRRSEALGQVALAGVSLVGVVEGFIRGGDE